MKTIKYAAEPSPGPWRLMIGEDALPNRFAISDKDGHKICTVESFPSGSTGKADAKLIRSCPEMRAVLEQVELLMRVNAPMTDGSPMHKAVIKVLGTEK